MWRLHWPSCLLFHDPLVSCPPLLLSTHCSSARSFVTSSACPLIPISSRPLVCLSLHHTFSTILPSAVICLHLCPLMLSSPSCPCPTSIFLLSTLSCSPPLDHLHHQPPWTPSKFTCTPIPYNLPPGLHLPHFAFFLNPPPILPSLCPPPICMLYLSTIPLSTPILPAVLPPVGSSVLCFPPLCLVPLHQKSLHNLSLHPSPNDPMSDLPSLCLFTSPAVPPSLCQTFLRPLFLLSLY